MIQKLREYTRSHRRILFDRFIGSAAAPLRIADLGGTVPFWLNWGLANRPKLEVTLVNNHGVDTVYADTGLELPNIRRLNRDVLTLTSEELASFDIIFSNSLIEHLSGLEPQTSLASAIRASKTAYFIQTPNKLSPVDPHFPKSLPFFAAWPKPFQARMLTLSGLGSGSGPRKYSEAIEHLESYYHPLTRRQMQQLFPEAEITVERPLGVPMSIIAHWKPPTKT